MAIQHVLCTCPVTKKQMTWSRVKESTIADCGDGSMLGSLADTWALYSPALVKRARKTGEMPLKKWLKSLELADELGYDHVQLDGVTDDSILVVGLAF